MSIAPICKKYNNFLKIFTSTWNYLFSGFDLCAKIHIGIAVTRGMSIAGVVERIF